MYASCSTDADVGHQQRILQQLEARKRAREMGASEPIRGLASSSASFPSSSNFPQGIMTVAANVTALSYDFLSDAF